MTPQTTKSQYLPIFLIILVCSIIYANSLNVPFHFDDENNIQNPVLKMETLSTEQFIKTFSDGTIWTRPISNLSFAANYFIGRYRVQGYHLVNIGIHACAGVFFYLLLHLTLNLPVNRLKYERASSIALTTALLWVTHPLATQSVTYIVQRMNSMAAMFFILTMLFYAVGRGRQVSDGNNSSSSILVWFVASAIAGLLAIGSKEIAATLPFFILLYEWYFFQNLRWEWLKKKIFWLIGVFVLIGSIAYIYTSGEILDRIFYNCSGRDFTIFERVLTQLRVVIHYITLIIYPNPNRLVFDYDFPLSTSLISPLSTLFSFFAIVALMVLAIVAARRERLISFCLFWFTGNLVIESSIICLELVFEHRTYLPSMFLLLFFVLISYRIGVHKVFVPSVMVVVIMLFGYWTIERNKVWRSSFSLWSDSISKYPNKSRSHSNLGLAYLEAGQMDQAESEFKRSLELFPAAEIAHNNLAGLYLAQGKRQEAEFHFQEALRIKPDYQTARINLGILKREQGYYQEAVTQFRLALLKNEQDPVISKNLGNALLRSGQPAEALPYLEKALLHSPQDLEVYLDIGETFSLLGRIEEAISVYRKTLLKDKNQVLAHYNLAMLLKLKGLDFEALAHYRETNRLMRHPLALKYDFANLLFRLGELNEAEKTYKDFLTITPTFAMAYNNLGLVFINQGRFKEAVQQFQTAVNFAPSFQLAVENLRLAKEQLQVLEQQR